ncbi:uncharacterized protein K444DRAFT_61470 [Hyaloscypha bicolor E]|uniref:Uncharacterized protein n=1 Tax=Hyaloscypha bicolor E TaxID=1095630 RepID=A0A2J6T027_9HELO|nr:uncharacterized protein K444DRAFT_61470 [Hyaloscypha bicolor E]PMD56367.1 hypothetical protein K444DRAFT_61470 [Hyaloscypha bicolor E]
MISIDGDLDPLRSGECVNEHETVTRTKPSTSHSNRLEGAETSCFHAGLYIAEAASRQCQVSERRLRVRQRGLLLCAGCYTGSHSYRATLAAGKEGSHGLGIGEEVERGMSRDTAFVCLVWEVVSVEAVRSRIQSCDLEGGLFVSPVRALR